MSFFQVGEVAIAVNCCTSLNHFNGTECTVLSVPPFHIAGHWLPYYEVSMCDGSRLLAYEHNLRKRFDGGSWDELRDIFEPREVSV